MPTAKRAWVSRAQAKVTPLPPKAHSWALDAQQGVSLCPAGALSTRVPTISFKSRARLGPSFYFFCC